jgi:predicted O-linked N-acetylglucosamine transferase (SPINDLY family)
MNSIDKINKLYHDAIQFHMIGDLKNAFILYDEILIINSNHHESLHYKGVIFLQRKDFKKSIYFITKALELNPNNSAALSNLGLAYQNSHDYEAACNAFKQSLLINPNFANAHFNIANVYYYLLNFELAKKHLKISLDLNPDFIDAYNSLGNIYQEERDFSNAITNYDKAISLDPTNSNAYNNKANVLHSLNNTSEALVLYLQASKYDPLEPSIFNNLGNIYRELNILDKSLHCYEMCKKLSPNFEFVDGSLLTLNMLMCNWNNLDLLVSYLIEKVNNFQRVSAPFPLLAAVDDPMIHLNSAKIWATAKASKNTSFSIFNFPQHSKKIKLAYFSSDFRNHAVSFLIAELFVLHDRENFEVIGFSISKNPDDELTEQIKYTFDQYIDANELSDIEVFNICRALRIDIAIDLNGWTANNRYSLFSQRLAPIQISYLGFLGSMGAECYDYIIADETIIPIHLQSCYSEKIIYLPSFQINDSRRIYSQKFLNKLDFEIPINYFVFCCFNNVYKITPSVFDIWMNILLQAPESVLLLSGENEWATKNLLNKAYSRGVDKSRIIFLDRSTRDEYLSRYSLCNLFLDTFPYCAGTTASDSLWSEVPVLTCIGNSFASRMGSSILNSIGLQELITADLFEYQKLAIKLASNSNYYSSIKRRLVSNKNNFPLFKPKEFVRSIEKAYFIAHNRFLNTFKLENIFVSKD